MDSELKEVLEAMREENAAAHQETRRRLETLDAKFGSLGAKFESLDAKFETAQSENAAAHVETRRQMGAIAESFQHKLDLVIERVLGNGEKIDQLDAKVDRLFSDHESRITRLEISASLHGQL